MSALHALASQPYLIQRRGNHITIELLWFVNPGRVAPKGTGLADGSHTSQPGHRPRKDEITQAVNPTVVIGGDVQTFCHGAG